MSHRGYVTRGDESPGLGLWEDAVIKSLVPTKTQDLHATIQVLFYTKKYQCDSLDLYTIEFY